jgi:hypothetical protein
LVFGWFFLVTTRLWQYGTPFLYSAVEYTFW